MPGIDPPHALFYGLALTALAGGWLLLLQKVSPRLLMLSYPERLRGTLPAPSRIEYWLAWLARVPVLALLVGVPLWASIDLNTHGLVTTEGGLFLDAFVVGMIFNLAYFIAVEPALAHALARRALPPIPSPRFEFLRTLRAVAVGTVVVTAVALAVSKLAAS